MTETRTLLLVRHAKSSWKDESLADIDRPLNKRGRRDAPEMGRRLRHRGIAPDVIISSPAVRAIATATIIAEETGCRNELIVDEDIYGATPADLLDVIRKIEGSVAVAMIVGHNPTLTELANHFSEDEIENVPTSGILMLSIADWNQPGQADFLGMDYPKKSTTS